jgi:uncharacterized cupin superfamily protein
MTESKLRTTKKRAGEPDEVMTAEKTRAELIRFGDTVVLRGVMEPGWRWAEHIKPLAGTERCEVAHLIYGVSGRMRVRTNEGEELLVEPGDFIYLAPGHDAWVEGDEPFVMLDLIGGQGIAEAVSRSTEERRKAA